MDPRVRPRLLAPFAEPIIEHDPPAALPSGLHEVSMRLDSQRPPRPAGLLAVLALVSLLAGVPPRAGAQSARAARSDSVDRLVMAEMARQHIPGVALAVVRAGRVVRAQGYGLANVELNVPVTPRTVFKIGSVSKQFLATGIMLLVQDGRMALDDPVAKYVAGAPASWAGITIRRLLSHTSGIVREGPAFEALEVQPDSVVVRSAFPLPLEFAPGAKYQYCNVCYFALADIIRSVSGRPWSDFLAERVFRPAGMRATRTTTTTELVPDRASGYVWRRDTLRPAPEYLALRPSGAFLSTVLDLAKWDSVLYTDAVLRRATRDEMWTPVALADGSRYGYGFGWTLDSIAGHRRVHHGGSLPGFRAELARFPSDSLTVIVLTNGDGATPERIARGVAEVVLRGAPAAGVRR